MPVTKFRSVADMPAPLSDSGKDLIARIRALWNRAFLLSPPDIPRGVQRFSSIEEANRARLARLTSRLRRNAFDA